MVVLANPRITTADEAKASGKPVILVMGGIHPGEFSGKEAHLMLMRDILLGDKEYFLDNQIILVCPNFNVDGNEARSTSTGLPKFRGQRTNALGYDLNRDAIKLETNSVRKLTENVFNKWDPVLIYDTHHMGGMKHAYPIVYTASTVPTSSLEPRDYLLQTLFPPCAAELKTNGDLKSSFIAGRMEMTREAHGPRPSGVTTMRHGRSKASSLWRPMVCATGCPFYARATGPTLLKSTFIANMFMTMSF